MHKHPISTSWQDILKQFDIGVLINGIPLKHGDFHNIVVLLIFSGFVGLLLKTAGMKFKDSFIFAGIGFGAHIFEDVLVYNPGYAFLWPFTYGLKRTINAYIGAIIFSIIMMSAIGFYDFNLKEEGIAGNIVDNWQFTQNGSWDSTVFHNGSHSAKIEILGNESRFSGVWRSNKSLSEKS